MSSLVRTSLPAPGRRYVGRGDKGTWGMGGYDQSLTESSIREAWEASIAAGVVLFDTAEIYGGGESERIIGRLLAADPGARNRVVIATKFMPSPWKLNVRAALLSAARHSRERLGIDVIDLYQFHGPISLRSHDALAEALATAHAEGIVRAVGVSNYSAKETCSIDAALRTRGLRLASNQIEFSLLRSMPLRVGLISVCRELGVVPLAYSPIGQGRLTGKYSAANPPPRGRSFRPIRWPRWTRWSPCCAASVRPMVTAPRARWRWPGSSPRERCRSPGPNPDQAQQNAGALGWRLTSEELELLTAASLYGTRRISQRIWQHG